MQISKTTLALQVCRTDKIQVTALRSDRSIAGKPGREDALNRSSDFIVSNRATKQSREGGGSRGERSRGWQNDVLTYGSRGGRSRQGQRPAGAERGGEWRRRAAGRSSSPAQRLICVFLLAEAARMGEGGNFFYF
jgi:hypothetical protein